jgi:hypothetical protein
MNIIRAVFIMGLPGAILGWLFAEWLRYGGWFTDRKSQMIQQMPRDERIKRRKRIAWGIVLYVVAALSLYTLIRWLEG